MLTREGRTHATAIISHFDPFLENHLFLSLSIEVVFCCFFWFLKNRDEKLLEFAVRCKNWDETVSVPCLLVGCQRWQFWIAFLRLMGITHSGVLTSTENACDLLSHKTFLSVSTTRTSKVIFCFKAQTRNSDPVEECTRNIYARKN